MNANEMADKMIKWTSYLAAPAVPAACRHGLGCENFANPAHKCASCRPATAPAKTAARRAGCRGTVACSCRHCARGDR